MAKKRFPIDLEIATVICEGSKTNTLSPEDLRHQVQLGRFPAAILADLSIPDLQVVTSVAVLAKLANKHKLSPAIIVNLHHLIGQPKAIFSSASRKDSIVIVCMMMVEGDPLIASIVVDTPDAALKPNMHWLTSAYAKDNHQKLVDWENEGLLLWRAKATQDDESETGTMPDRMSVPETPKGHESDLEMK